MPAVSAGIFSPPPRNFITFPYARKVFQSLAGNFLNSPKTENSSGPRMRHFTFPMPWKSLAPGDRPGLAPGTRIFQHGKFRRSHSRDRKTFLACGNVKGLPRRIERLFRHGRGKKNNSQYIMLQYHDATMTATVVPTTAETLATAQQEDGC